MAQELKQYSSFNAQTTAFSRMVLAVNTEKPSSSPVPGTAGIMVLTMVPYSVEGKSEFFSALATNPQN